MGYYSLPRRSLRGVRQLLYPRRCPFCNRVLGSVPECPDCAEELEQLRRKPGMRLDMSQHYLGNLTGGAAPFRYEGCVRAGILRAKYQAAPWTAVEMGVLLAKLAFGSEIRMQGAEPVPQHLHTLNDNVAMQRETFLDTDPFGLYTISSGNQNRGSSSVDFVVYPLIFTSMIFPETACSLIFAA